MVPVVNMSTSAAAKGSINSQSELGYLAHITESDGRGDEETVSKSNFVQAYKMWKQGEESVT
jgi:hypothetical protein